MISYIISAISYFTESKPKPPFFSTAFLAGGTMISMLFWLFCVAILIKVFNSAFKQTEQQDQIETVKKIINQKQQQKNKDFKPERI
jgi:hypothetical protein